MFIRGLRNTTRLLVIVLTLARYNALFFWKGEPTNAKGKCLGNALSALGPTFVKLGQVLSTRSDLVGQEIAFALADLQDRVSPFSSQIVHAIIEAQLGKPASILFASFDDTPAAAASIAQVHFATLHDGKDVAIKVLRPHIEIAFKRDVALLYWLADVAEWFQPNLRRFKLSEVAAAFENMIRFELDLRFEAAAAVTLRENLQHDKGFYVPEIYWEYTAQRVLTLERIYGIPVNDIPALEAAGHDKNKIVDETAISFFKQVFRDGFFHADMHPGNMFVLKNGEIAVVDFGIMGRIDQKSRLYLAQILHGFLTEDYYNLAKVHFDAGFVPPHKSVDDFALALMALTKPIIGRKLSEISVAKLLGQLFTTAETFEMEAQPHLLLLHKNMMLNEGVGRMLNPEVNMWQVVEPLIKNWAKEHMGVKAQLKTHVTEAISLLKHLPNIVKKLEQPDAAPLSPVPPAARPSSASDRKWLTFAWTALAVFIVAYVFK